jgi:phosphoribosylcarboxyaminoimidazole (NCAIR) mutase
VSYLAEFTISITATISQGFQGAAAHFDHLAGSSAVPPCVPNPIECPDSSSISSMRSSIDAVSSSPVMGVTCAIARSGARPPKLLATQLIDQNGLGVAERFQRDLCSLYSRFSIGTQD